MKPHRALPLVLVMASTACGSDDEATPASFEWCGGALCDWTVEAGEIARAPTWHEKDYGARLLNAPVVISRPITIDASHCTRFSLVGYVDAAAQLVLELDLLDATIIEFEQIIPETRWEAQTFLVPPVEFRSDRAPPLAASLRLHKRDAGNVVLARLEVATVSCDTAARVPIASEPAR
jgi:hypothetical protein